MLHFLVALIITAHAENPALQCQRSLRGIIKYDESVLLSRKNQRVLLVAITDKTAALVRAATDYAGIPDRAVASPSARASDDFKRLIFDSSSWIPRFLRNPVVYLRPVRPIARNLVAWMDSDPGEDFVVAVDGRLLPKIKRRLIRRLGFSEANSN